MYGMIVEYVVYAMGLFFECEVELRGETFVNDPLELGMWTSVARYTINMSVHCVFVCVKCWLLSKQLP